MAASATALAIAALMDPAFNSNRRPNCSKLSFGSALFFALPFAGTAEELLWVVFAAIAPGGRSACHSAVRMSCEAIVKRRKLNKRVANSL